MKLIVIDLSEDYFSPAKNGEVPPKRSGKFVQIRNETEQTEYLVFAPKERAPFHANIVEQFCSKTPALTGSYSGEEDSIYFTIKTGGWRVVGGGKWEIDEEARKISLYDNSMAYGDFDRASLEDKLKAQPRFKDFNILIY